MIVINQKSIDNVIILKLIQGEYEELNKIKIEGIRGLGGFTIQETLPYLLNSKTEGVIAYNFRNKEECQFFKKQLKLKVKEINNGIKGVFKFN